MKRLTLGDVCKKESSNIAQKDLQDKKGAYPIYGASGLIKQVDFYQQDKEYIAVVKDGAGIGRTMLLPAYSSVIGTMQYLLPKEGIPIDIKYLFYAVEHMNLAKYFSGATIPHIYFRDYQKEPINIPDIETQRKISQIFGKIDALITSRKEQRTKLDQIVKSRFVEMFGDPVDNPKNYLVNSLQELIDMGYITYHLDGNHGGDYPRSEEFVGSGVPYIGANSIVNGEIDFSMAKFLTVERAGKLRKGIAQNDDVLFAHNATVGPTVVLKTTEPKVILSTSLTAYRCNQSKLLPNYLKAYMQSDGFVRQYSGEMKQTTRNQVPITAQKKYLFLVPPIVEQEQFATFVEQTDKSKLAVQQSIDQLETLKKSLMQKYFG